MKKTNSKALLAFLAFTIFVFGKTQAQIMDSVRVAPGRMTTLMFAEPITFVKSEDESYEGEVHENLMTLKSSYESLEPKTLLLKTASAMYLITLVLDRDSKKSFYDYTVSPEERRMAEAQQKLDQAQAANNATAPENIQAQAQDTTGNTPLFQGSFEGKEAWILGQAKKRYSTVGYFKNSIFFMLDDVLVNNAENEMYFVLRVENRTRIDYKIDFIGFELRNQHRGVMAGSQQVVNIVPLWQSATNTVKAEGEERLVFIFRIVSISDKQNFNFSMRETDGFRNLNFDIGKSIMAEAVPVKTDR